MAVGTTSDSNLTRDELIDASYRNIGQAVGATGTTRAAQLLNLIIREEDARGTDQAKHLWALDEVYILLKADGVVYDSTEIPASSIMDLSSANYMNSSGDEVPIDIVSTEQYEEIGNKDDTGDPQKIYLKKDRDLSSQKIYVWPIKTSLATASVATGSDALNYTCVMDHTAANENKPITGASYTLFWKQTGSGGSAWAADTAYDGTENLRIVYKRPLFDFDLSSDNPDMPQQWTRYLMWRLSWDLTPSFHIDQETKNDIRSRMNEARQVLFSSMKVETDDIHDKGTFF